MISYPALMSFAPFCKPEGVVNFLPLSHDCAKHIKKTLFKSLENNKDLNQVSRFGCTDNNRLFKDAPAVAYLCSEAGLERIIASCMQTVCPQDEEGICLS